ncbi:MAG: xanthine dehydrogenase FAD-binding subunit XdhB [Eubacteriales bacterium]|nr:xanthine dehydrogenase FAD-binding subunit XdhB [Eubacteriales bacterium]
MYFVKKLYLPETLPEALKILKEHPETTILAGGTDVLVKMRHKRMRDVTLLSLAKLPLSGVEDKGDEIVIGPGTTFTALAENPIMQTRLPMLCTAARSMGGPQIQNVATIGGNVCNGATSADSAPSLFALDAVLTLTSAGGDRRVPIREFYTGPGRVKLESGEMLTAIHIPAGEQARWGGVYIKFSTRKAMDIAILGSAAVCELGEDGRVIKAAIAMGVAAPTPVRCTDAEALLTGKTPTAELLQEAGRLALTACSPRSSWRATKEYREALIQELSVRAFQEAYRLAGGKAL